jgi:signal transduction histidine kinase/putative methionine-R-sulfoxide reductase with GAF domain
MGHRAKPAKPKVGPKRPLVRKASKDDGSKVRELEKRLADALEQLQTNNHDLTEALEQQTATSKILGLIRSARTDVTPVFDAIAENAARLCDAGTATVFRFDGQLLHLEAHQNVDPVRLDALRQAYPLVPSRGAVAGRVLMTRAVVHVTDVGKDPEYKLPTATTVGFRTVLGVPMLQEGVAIGVILVARDRVAPFTDSHIALLQTFADQAVIAIENVRLFTELQEKNAALTAAHAQVNEALERQTATGEILGVIASSPTDVQPVYDAIVRSAVTLCEATLATVYRREGDLVHLVGIQYQHPHAADVAAAYPAPVTSSLMSCRAILENAVVHLPDVDAEGALPPEGLRLAHLSDFRSVLSVPMRREGDAIGAILIGRPVCGRFPDEQITLLQTFADQAVIAIENVRLFTELQTRTAELSQSVGQLTALGEVGQAISSTLDLQTVLQTIVAHATELSGTDAGVVYEYDEHREVFVPRATAHLEAEIVQTMLATPVRKGEGATGRLAEVPEPIQLPDILEAAAPESRVRGALVRAGYRALLGVPLLREEHLLGGLTVIRKATGEFGPEVIDLMRTFATQSALAIQNARLFREIEIKSRELEVASQHKSEFLASMSHELRTPLNAIIGFSDVLLQGMFGEMTDKQTEYLKDILASGQHLLSLINDILDLSKIEAGRTELDLADGHLPSAIDDALLLMRERAGRHGLTLERHVDERLGEIHADQRKVKQVLLNLLSNAVKFTPDGGRIDVRAALVDDAVEISVTDTGVGIAPEDQEAVFEEFRQVGQAEKKAEGTGLGLALCRKFVELHGGRIWVKSAVGQGSTFTFAIPVRARPETEEVPRH